MAPFGASRAGLMSVAEDDIPDRVVNRPDDDESTTDDDPFGLKFSTTDTWAKFQGRVSSLTEPADDEEMVIGDTDGNDISVIDISDLSSEDVATFDELNLDPGTYAIYTRTDSDRQRGFFDDPDYEYTSDDGKLTIDSGWDARDNTTRDDVAYNILEIGNINLD